jgi:hypothetical protein
VLGYGPNQIVPNHPPGRYVVRLRPEGRAPLEREVTLVAGEVSELHFELP